MRISLLLILINVSLLLSDDDIYTLVISFDGFRYDYFDMAFTPNFDKFVKEGTKAESLIPVFPSLTFPNHYSIATGYYSDQHKIIGNTFYSKKLQKTYSMRDQHSVRDGDFYGAEPIWVTAAKNDINSATYYWIGSEAEINGYRPSIYKYYDGSVSFESRVDSIVSWFNYSEDRRPRICMLYFNEPDYTGHVYGTETNNIVQSILEMDKLLEYTITRLSGLDIYEKLNIIIVSDHGMVDTNKNKVILIDEYINLDNFQILYGPSVTALNYISKSNDFHLRYNQIKFMSIFSKNNIPYHYHYKNKDMPDYLLVADMGWFITTSEKLKDQKKFPLGMHGYDPKSKSMHGIFIAKGPSIRSDSKIKSFKNINIYPLICNIYDIKPNIIEGSNVDWDFNQIKQILNP